jgi:exonuclease SbcC
MRILAIRGRNLASLAGDFAIDFDAEPLAGSGIFAITGPTGAGKSTLLDAVCLALFNEIPRLRAAPSSGKIGIDEDKGLSIRDTRAILRHGAGDGFAEVDFAMPGGARYRARWSVKRARGRADGAIQNYVHDFERLDTGERMGGTRKETKEAIQTIIGLSAEQFGRAVLLAQGDFEAFIRADANERALLLERLTGSEIYTRLGKAAYEKGRAFEDAIQVLRTRLADQHGLDDAQRQDAEATLAAAREAEKDADARLDQLRAAERWDQRARELGGEVAKAETALDRAQTAQAEAAPRREALTRRRKALAHAPVWRALLDAEKRRDDTAKALEEAVLTLASAQDAEADARKRASDAAAAAVSFDTQCAAMVPAIAAARELDVKLEGAARQRDEAFSLAQQGRMALTQAEEHHRAASEAHASAIARLSEAQEWVAQNAALEPLAQREAEFADDLTRHRTLAAEISGNDARRSALEQAQQDAHRRWTTAQDRFADAATKHQQAAQALATAEQAAPAPP